MLYASGYKPEKNLAHYRTLQALPLILGAKRKGDAEYLDNCRTKRNVVGYDYVGEASSVDADEFIRFTVELRTEVLEWLIAHHPELKKK